MRQSTWTISVPENYTEQFDLEKVVSRVEQRWNDGDYVFARDVGTAWEIETILVNPAATKGVDWDAVPGVDPGVRHAIMNGNVTGVDGRNSGKGNSLNVSGDGVEGGILLHEGAHLYGNPYHQMDPGDGLFGGNSFFGRNNVQVLFPQPAGGVILCQSSYGFKTTMFGWAIRASGQGFSFFGNTVKPDEGFELHTEEPIQQKTWYHLVMVMDREAKKLRAYVNNKEVTATSSTATIPDAVIEYHAPLRLFNGPGWKGWGAVPMLVDELKLFASALTPAQVAELYAEGKDAPVPELPYPVKAE